MSANPPDSSSATAPKPGHAIGWRWLLVVFLVALAARGTWGVRELAASVDPAGLSFPDEQQYWQIAESLRTGTGLQDELGFRATRMPLYPAFLSLFVGLPNGIAAARATHWVAGAIVAVLTAWLAGGLLGRRVGVLAGFWVAIDPLLVFTSSLLLTETPFMVALLLLWGAILPLMAHDDYAARMPRWLGVGIAAALAVYLRESSLGLVVLVLLMAVCGRRFDWRRLAGAALSGVVVIVLLLPWAARNDRTIGQWCWLTTRGGISLYDGVGPQADGGSDLGDVKQMPAVRGLDEVAWNQYFLRESWKALREDPARIVRLAGVKLGRLWNPFPNVETHRSPLTMVVSAAWNLPTFVLAVVGAILLATRRDYGGVRIAIFLLLPALYVSMLHGVFVGSVRYRLVAMPLLEVLAAFAVVTAVDCIRRRSRDVD
ncbi:MAG: glycosyltransferase family 39 protein [Planctomycetes bacterium]|nr:glycosyltransferase family 39 protein [Planctomycetota bacterium]